MKTKIFQMIAFYFVFSIAVNAQGEFFHGRMNPERMKKIDQLERVKLMDILEVDDETLVKFLKELREFKFNTWELFAQKDSLAKQVQKDLEDKATDDERITKTIDKLFEIDRQTCELKSKFLKDAKSTLPPKELAKFILFEQRFRRELMKIYEKKRFQRKHTAEETQ
ncbi:MAG: hypothetical protein GXO87_10190 [Chlorobi bacterium]|nr:hypothetical protein [Chlorobiota bacterium]